MDISMEILIDGNISSFCRNTVGPNSIGPNSIGLYNLSWPYNSPYNVLSRKPKANGYLDLLSDAFFEAQPVMKPNFVATPAFYGFRS